MLSLCALVSLCVPNVHRDIWGKQGGRWLELELHVDLNHVGDGH